MTCKKAKQNKPQTHICDHGIISEITHIIPDHFCLSKKLHEWLRCLTFSEHQSCQWYCMCKNLKFTISSDKSGPCFNLKLSAHLHRHPLCCLLSLGQEFLHSYTHTKRYTTSNNTYNIYFLNRAFSIYVIRLCNTVFNPVC